MKNRTSVGTWAEAPDAATVMAALAPMANINLWIMLTRLLGATVSAIGNGFLMVVLPEAGDCRQTAAERDFEGSPEIG
ncbi:hypothetical protein STAQ_37410 [Allostella sp. ATCC 35155]|nr:hypothetical protein STAQ_37410 [Stella sp. ATCC 35155]